MINNESNSSEIAHKQYLEILAQIEPFYIAILFTVGLIGNSLSFAIFVSSKLKKKESNSILASLSLADNFFLISLALVNLKHIGLDFFNTYEIVCKLAVFLTFVFSFLSVWYVSLFSIERFIAVMFPLHRFSICNHRRNHSSIFVLFLFALAFYSFSLVATGIEVDKNENTQCVTHKDWYNTTKVISIVDACITIIIPFFVIFFINVSISFKLMRLTSYFYVRMRPLSIKRNRKGGRGQDRRRTSSNLINVNNIAAAARRSSSIRDFFTHTAKSSTSELAVAHINLAAAAGNGVVTTTAECSSQMPSHTGGVGGTGGGDELVYLADTLSSQRNLKRRSKSYSRTTRMLVLISLTFILLNSLMAYSRLRHLFVSPASPDNNDDDYQIVGEEQLNDEVLERLACYLYYLNFSVNFFLYVLNKSTFREILLEIFKINIKKVIPPPAF